MSVMILLLFKVKPSCFSGNYSILTKLKEIMSFSGSIIWNAIPNEIKTTAALSSFSNKLVKWMTQAYFW